MEHEFLQNMMNQAYDKFDSGFTRAQWMLRLNWDEKIAVVAGNLNYQVGNGGFVQWADNGYIDTADLLLEITNEMATETSLEVAALIEQMLEIWEEYLEYQDDDSWQDMFGQTDSMDTRFYQINDQFLVEIEGYIKLIQEQVA